METKHTPGPWAIYAPKKGQDGYPHNISIGADTPTRSTYIASIPGGVHYEWAQENARRIVACVNACEGISTGDLELRGWTELGRIAQQRDQLIATAKQVVACWEKGDLAEAVRELAAIISKVQP